MEGTALRSFIGLLVTQAFIKKNKLQVLMITEVHLTQVKGVVSIKGKLNFGWL